MTPVDESAEYFRMREARERRIAADATSEEQKFVHLALAENYQALAEEAEERG